MSGAVAFVPFAAFAAAWKEQPAAPPAGHSRGPRDDASVRRATSIAGARLPQRDGSAP